MSEITFFFFALSCFPGSNVKSADLNSKKRKMKDSYLNVNSNLNANERLSRNQYGDQKHPKRSVLITVVNSKIGTETWTSAESGTFNVFV